MMCSGGDTLTVIATSDLHGARISALANLVRATNGGVILVDNGDLFGGPSGLLLSLDGGPCAMVQRMNRLGLAALNVGNHDLDQGVEALLERARQAEFPVLSANLFDGDERLLPDRVEVDTPVGRVGITGAITQVAWDMWPPSLRERLRLTDPVTALRASCAALHLHCDRVIALAHFGHPIGPEPPEENPGEALVKALGADAGDGRPLADVVVMGHTHVPHASVHGHTAVLSPPSGGAGFGHAVLAPGAVTAELVMTAGESAPDLGPDPEVSAALASLLDRPLRTDAATLGDQLLAAAKSQGADGLVITRRVEPQGPPVRTVGQGLARMPLLEHLVLLELDATGLAEVLATRDRHVALADAAQDAQGARRRRWHRWHALCVLVDPQPGPTDGTRRLLVPASWSGGYAGYDPFLQAQILAQPGLHLVQLLLVASRNDDKQRGRSEKEHTKDGTRR